MFSSPYLEIPIDKDDPRGREPLIPLESVGVAFESYYAKTDGQNPPFGSRSRAAGKTFGCEISGGKTRPRE